MEVCPCSREEVVGAGAITGAASREQDGSKPSAVVKAAQEPTVRRGIPAMRGLVRLLEPSRD